MMMNHLTSIDSIEITTEETVPRKVTETIAAALQHSLYNGSYYTSQEKVNALEEWRHHGRTSTLLLQQGVRL